jgi:hypothetical protein
MITVLRILQQIGPTRSSEVVRRLVKENHLTQEAARKRVSRAQEPVKRIKGIRLPNNERFLYLDEQFGKEEFLESFSKTFKEAGTSAGRALYGLEAYSGTIPESLFATISGAPTFKTKGQLLYSSVKEQLQRNRLIYLDMDPIYNEVISLWNSEGLTDYIRARLQVESIVLSILRSWIAKIGMASYNKVHIRGEKPPTFGPCQWDLVGPSYIRALVEYKKGQAKNGFIVGDILLDKEVNLSDIKPFLYKCDLILNQKTHRPFIAMFIADRFSLDALNELRKRGILIASPSTLFGDETAKALHNLVNTLKNAAAAIINNPESVFEIVSRIAKLEGASFNLRSVALEFIVARLYSLEGYNIDMRQQVRAKDGKLSEIDIKAVRADEVVCVECKGIAPGNTVKREDIADWIKTSLPVIKDWLKRMESLPNKIRFEFCTSGRFDPDAESFVENIKARHKKMPIAFTEGRDIIARLRKLNQNSIVKIFNEHFHHTD